MFKEVSSNFLKKFTTAHYEQIYIILYSFFIYTLARNKRTFLRTEVNTEARNFFSGCSTPYAKSCACSDSARYPLWALVLIKNHSTVLLQARSLLKKGNNMPRWKNICHFAKALSDSWKVGGAKRLLRTSGIRTIIKMYVTLWHRLPREKSL